MENKTALQELIEIIQEERKTEYHNSSLNFVYQKAIDLLEKEKEQMINFAFNFYYDFSNEMEVPFHKITENKDNAEYYYNKLASENKTKVNEEDKVVLDDLDLQNTNKSFLPEHNPFEDNSIFNELTGFILDDITYKILNVDKDIILKKSVLSDYIYEYSKKRFIEKYNLGRIRLLYGEF